MSRPPQRTTRDSGDSTEHTSVRELGFLATNPYQSLEEVAPLSVGWLSRFQGPVKALGQSRVASWPLAATG